MLALVAVWGIPILFLSGVQLRILVVVSNLMKLVFKQGVCGFPSVCYYFSQSQACGCSGLARHLYSVIVLLVQDLLCITAVVDDGLLQQARPRTLCCDKVQLG